MKAKVIAIFIASCHLYSSLSVFCKQVSALFFMIGILSESWPKMVLVDEAIDEQESWMDVITPFSIEGNKCTQPCQVITTKSINLW